MGEGVSWVAIIPKLPKKGGGQIKTLPLALEVTYLYVLFGYTFHPVDLYLNISTSWSRVRYLNKPRLTL